MKSQNKLDMLALTSIYQIRIVVIPVLQIWQENLGNMNIFGRYALILYDVPLH